MGKMTILGLRRDREELLDQLMRSGAVEIIEDKDADPAAIHSAAFADNMDMRARLTRTITDLQGRFPKAKELAGKKLAVTEDEFLIPAEEQEELRGLVARHDALLLEEEEIRHAIAASEQQIAQLLPWKDIPLDLADRKTRRTSVIYGIFMDAASLDNFEHDLLRDFPLAAVYFLEEAGVFPAKIAIVSIDDQMPRVRARLASCAFHEIPRLPFTGSARETIGNLEKENEAREEELSGINEELSGIADRTGRLMTYHDYLLFRSDRQEAGDKFHDLSYTFFLNVWVPDSDAEKIGGELADRYGAVWSYKKADKGEDTPVKLKNNPFIRAFEVILEMYGAPSSQETDPMPVMAPFYMILFGMMLSDVGYGLMLVAATAYLLFVRKAEGGMRQMSMLLFLSGISSIIWGFLFGGFFGDMITAVTGGKASFPVLWFNPMDDPVKLLIYSMLFGVIHLFFGLGIHIRNEKMQGNLIGGLADSVTWYLIIPGLALMLAGGSLTSDPATAALLPKIGQWLVIGGAAFGLIFAGHGIKNPFKRLIKGLGALYGITGYLSDILSYARILALVLATSVIATVVNMLGMLGGQTVVGYILFAVVGVFGHSLNLALSALSAFVHTSRLQYVELFGKFFVGGGSFWNPLRRRTSYVKIEDRGEKN